MIEVPQGEPALTTWWRKGDKNIGEAINLTISALAEANDLKGVIDIADFNDEDKLGKGKEMIDRLTKLIGIFEGLISPPTAPRAMICQVMPTNT